MPDRPGVDDNESLKRLIGLWRDGEADLASRQNQIWRSIVRELERPDPNLIRVDRLKLAAGRLEELSGVASAVADDLVDETQRWLRSNGLVDVYGAGVLRVAQFAYTLPHQAAVQVLADDLFDDVLKLTQHVDEQAKGWVRRVGRELTGFKLTGGQAVKAQAREFERQLRHEFVGRGITAVTYRDGSRHGFGEYAEMLLRTKTAVAYNVGTLNQSRGLGIQFVEILDGSLCGLTAHEDTQLANGMIVPVEIAAAFPIAHPNCRRSLNPRPDVTPENLSTAPSVQSDESRADQAAWEAYLRAQQASRGSRGPLTGSGGGRGGLTGRTATGPVGGQRAALTGARARADTDRLRRREYVLRTKAQAAAAREAEALERARAAARAGGFRGQVDPDVLRKWGVTERQWLNARAIVNDVRADIRGAARAQADEVGSWLFDNDLADLTRPARLVRRTDLISSDTRFVRTQGGYDWLEQLDGPEAARIRKRMVDSDLFTPDVLSDVVRQKTGQDFTDDEAMGWLVDRWLQEDALRSVASGRLPKYADPGSLMPAEQGLEGYRLDQLFGVELDDAAGHIATVQAEAAAREAAQTLGTPSFGPAPWEMEFPDYLRDLEQVEDILGRTQLAPGIDPGEAFAYARGRIGELAPELIDPDGNLNPVELFERIRLTAQAAGLPTP
jgi:hypothetical protein